MITWKKMFNYIQCINDSQFSVYLTSTGEKIIVNITENTGDFISRSSIQKTLIPFVKFTIKHSGIILGEEEVDTKNKGRMIICEFNPYGENKLSENLKFHILDRESFLKSFDENTLVIYKSFLDKTNLSNVRNYLYVLNKYLNMRGKIFCPVTHNCTHFTYLFAYGLEIDYVQNICSICFLFVFYFVIFFTIFIFLLKI